MAVNVSTLTSICLYCGVSSTAIDNDFHEIFNEVGLEMQLPQLVENIFGIKVNNESKKYLCDDCVSLLIELYDLEEHKRQQSINTAEVKKLAESNEDHQNNTYNEFITENELQVFDSGHIIEFTNFDALRENVTNSDDEDSLDQEFIQIDSNTSSKLPQLVPKSNENNSSNYITSTTTSQKDSEIIEDDEEQNSDIEIMVNRKTNNISDKLQLQENQETIIHDDQIIIIESEENDNNLEFIEESSFVADTMQAEEELEETLLVIDTTNTQTGDNNEELSLEDIFIEELEDISMEDVSIVNKAKGCTMESSNVNSLLKIGVNEAVSNATIESKNKLTCTEDGNITHVEEEDSIDSTFFEEEYLIEETRCSQEYDNVDLNEYLDNNLKTKFQDLQINWETECKLCFNKYNTFEELMKHACIREYKNKQQFCCVIDDCETMLDNLATLARHLILQHCHKLESIPIYGKCPDCQKSFSNIIDFNKHSCCRNIKRKPGTPNYCQYCDMDFQSLKRYVFHMQFHLTNRRPKICLLCGDIFNNSNDFFEHTQYLHTQKNDMACIKCDRFFKEKYIYDSHIELHKDSKFVFTCSLCPKKYTSKASLCQHMDVYHHDNNNFKAFECEHCGKEFVNKFSHRNHMQSHANDNQVESLICSACGFITNSLENIKIHIESDKDSPCYLSPIDEKILNLGYTCENCSIDFLTINHLKQHRLCKTHNDDLYYCGTCRRAFKSLRHMRNHSTVHKDVKDWKQLFPITRYFVCTIGDCKEFYPIWTTLYYHKKRPHKIQDTPSLANEFKCQFCQQMCSSKMSLAVHVARSHNNSNVKCPHCNRSHKSQKALQEHIDKFHIPVECDICFKKFKNQRNLKFHNNSVHLNVKRYFCKHCKKGYFHKSERDLHELKVHPKTSFKCVICNFVTTYEESFEIHMDKHKNQLKFKCLECGRKFGRKQLLKNHSKRHINANYSCAKYLKETDCKATFLTRKLWINHVLSEHKKTKLLQMVEDMDFEVLITDDDSKSDKDTEILADMALNDEDFELLSESDEQ